MPVRKIGLCYRSVGGRVPMGGGRRGVNVESTLERDFVLLSQFDGAVTGIEEQPVRILWAPGRSYVPDFLVTYGDGRPNDLVEVKYSTDKALLAGALEGRFAAARAYAADQGWRFRVVTEREIRTPRLANIRFLLPFRDRPVNPGLMVRIHALLQAQGALGVAVLADLAEGGPERRAHVLPTLWRAVARGELAADLEQPLTMLSILDLPTERAGA
ncbi:TnsA endonuclease N-terminal domain-containing protein [Nitrospirillum amazonense]|uniref:TnsA endonuclease N-terminal domain-containing protein n=1 Tax=Nitrospirillum amazonense TaxID=28077 RepID=UPI002DD43DF8|nr:TnsA endonuclease N-terminal domain-containing protein [Nitrospirillum amazonense]MEC4591905.1 TnsA endonuclease N-terminal domain-containing protein [Nitrospirillum amazonense]